MTYQRLEDISKMRQALAEYYIRIAKQVQEEVNPDNFDTVFNAIIHRLELDADREAEDRLRSQPNPISDEMRNRILGK